MTDAADELATEAEAEANGKTAMGLPRPGEGLQAAIEWERGIALAATDVRGDATRLDAAMFMRLWLYLQMPIPPAYIETVGRVTGKPYESTGIRSVQVQIDRMNNVLTPLWWWYQTDYEAQGQLCTVTVFVGDPSASPVEVSRFGSERPEFVDPGVLTWRSSRGGVDRGSTTGNVYKGSFTNAAKLAFARLGVGHEIYLGSSDFDPDVDSDAAKGDEVGREIAAGIWTRAKQLDIVDRLQLAASHVVGRDVGDCKTKAKAQDALAGLSFADAERLDGWLSQKADEQAGGE